MPKETKDDIDSDEEGLYDEDEQAAKCCKCCCKEGAKDPDGVGLKKSGRPMCTDVLFLAAFIASFMLTFIVISTATANGADYNKVTRGSDMLGRVCGMDEGVVDLPYAAWPWPMEYGIMVCVLDCTVTEEVMHPQMVIPYASVPYFNFCVPDPSVLLGASSVEESEIELEDGQTLTENQEISMSSSDLAFGEPYGDWAQTITDAMGDLFSASDAILISGFISLIVAFIVIALIGKFIKCLVIVLLIVVTISSLVLGYFCMDYGQNPLDYDSTLSETESQYMTWFGYFWLGFGGVFALVMFVLRQRIRIAMEVIKESAHAVADMPLIMFFPIVPVILAGSYMIFWVWGAATLYSVTVDTVVDSPVEVLYWFAYENDSFRNANPETYISKVFDSTQEYPAMWHFFHMLWVIQFLIYFCYLVFAGATADWYFARNDEKGNKLRGSEEHKLSRFPIGAAFKRTFLHHLGTIAVCSLIIAIIQFIRAMVHYIESKTKGDPPNQAQVVLFKIIHCCLACIECCADKINKNALIWTAIFGDGFATAACSSFKLILDNLGRVAAISVISHLIIAVGKLFVAIFTTLIGVSIIMYAEPYATEVSSVWSPGFVIFVLGYAVGSMFMAVFNGVIDCVFICFLVDDKFNSKEGKMFASPKLQALVNSKAISKECDAVARGEKNKRKHRKQMRASNKVEPVEME